MKNVLSLSAFFFTILLSCKKDIPEQGKRTIDIYNDATLGVMPPNSSTWPYYNEILGKKTKGKYADTSYRARHEPILFVGNSYPNYWDRYNNGFYTTFKGYPVLNRAFGGSSWVHITMWAEWIIKPYNARKLYLYEGTNELRRGESSVKVINDFKTAFNKIRSLNPNLRMVILSLIPCPTIWDKRDSVDWINTQYQEYIAQDSNAEYLDITTKAQLWNPRRIDSSLWLPDGVHPNLKLYTIFSSIMKPNMN